MSVLYFIQSLGTTSMLSPSLLPGPRGETFLHYKLGMYYLITQYWFQAIFQSYSYGLFWILLKVGAWTVVEEKGMIKLYATKDIKEGAL